MNFRSHIRRETTFGGLFRNRGEVEVVKEMPNGHSNGRAKSPTSDAQCWIMRQIFPWIRISRLPRLLITWKVLHSATQGRHHLGDHGKLTEVVQATEQAIVLRAQELLNSSDHHEERGEMAVATESLLAIKAHKLGWPSVPSKWWFALSPICRGMRKSAPDSPAKEMYRNVGG